MSRFTFRLQNVLDVREREVSAAQAEVELRKAAVRENVSQQEGLLATQVTLEQEFLAFSREGSAHDFLNYVEYRRRVEEGLASLRREQLRLELRVAEAEEVMLEARRAHRRLEIMKERALEEHLIEVQRKENEVIDEWGSLHGGRS